MAPAILYTFGHSVWSAAPELAIIELAYPASAIELKPLNLLEGENFNPSFLKKNPSATLPTLEVDGKAYTNTTDVISYLIKHAPTPGKPGNPAFIAEIHEDKYDPNFALLLTRNEDELKGKASGIPGLFVAQRQQALEKFSVLPEAAEYKEFYDGKIAANGGLHAIYQGKVPEEIKIGFFNQSKAHWEALRTYISDILPTYLPENGFIGGSSPGEDDFHAGAWIARIAATTGAQKSEEGLAGLEREVGKPLSPKLISYWNTWSLRESWKKTYAAGLH